MSAGEAIVLKKSRAFTVGAILRNNNSDTSAQIHYCYACNCRGALKLSIKTRAGLFHHNRGEFGPALFPPKAIGSVPNSQRSQVGLDVKTFRSGPANARNCNGYGITPW